MKNQINTAAIIVCVTIVLTVPGTSTRIFPDAILP